MATPAIKGMMIHAAAASSLHPHSFIRPERADLVDLEETDDGMMVDLSEKVFVGFEKDSSVGNQGIHIYTMNLTMDTCSIVCRSIS